MTEPGYQAPVSPMRDDIGTLQQRVLDQRRKQRQFHALTQRIRQGSATFITSPLRTLYALPTRYILHALVAIIVPVAFLLSHMPTLTFFAPQAEQAAFSDTPAGVGPLGAAQTTADGMVIGDPPLDADALPMPLSLTSRREALAPVVVPASISSEMVKLRTGPGLEYDDVARIAGGENIEVIGRYGEWLQVREGEGKPVYWVAGELVNIPEGSIYTLFEVPSEDIPPPPPPKVGTVLESGLNVRDGPGTNYVKLLSFDAGEELSLIERYKDWVHVGFENGYDGWVKTEYLGIQPGVLKRVPETPFIPDPNPALIGAINENSVNLRKGPGTVYDRAGQVGADSQVDLLARHKDWLQVQLSDGSKAWVFIDLVNVTPMALRRVPYTNNIPAPPVAVSYRSGGGGGGSGGTTSAATGGGGGGGGGAAAYIPASGDVASYALRFVGSRYVYGGASPGTGFDCSGFTQYVYRQYGVYLPHSAAAQYSTAYGAVVGSMNNLAPGDLMFFAGTYGRGISHVALYVGGGRMVHAMAPGLGVQVSGIWEGYWTSHYYGAIRVRR